MAARATTSLRIEVRPGAGRIDRLDQLMSKVRAASAAEKPPHKILTRANPSPWRAGVPPDPSRLSRSRTAGNCGRGTLARSARGCVDASRLAWTHAGESRSDFGPL